MRDCVPFALDFRVRNTELNHNSFGLPQRICALALLLPREISDDREIPHCCMLFQTVACAECLEMCFMCFFFRNEEVPFNRHCLLFAFDLYWPVVLGSVTHCTLLRRHTSKKRLERFVCMVFVAEHREYHQ